MIMLDCTFNILKSISSLRIFLLVHAIECCNGEFHSNNLLINKRHFQSSFLRVPTASTLTKYDYLSVSYYLVNHINEEVHCGVASVLYAFEVEYRIYLLYYVENLLLNLLASFFEINK